MNDGPGRDDTRRSCREPIAWSGGGSRWAFGSFWTLLFVGTFFVTARWAGFHGILLGCVGLLIWLRPPVVALPRVWWVLAGIFVLAGAGALLPADWFTVPEWRRHLAELGVETGSLVAIQARQATEAYTLFAITLVTGLWLAGHRPSPSQLRFWAMAFTLGVAVYALCSMFRQYLLTEGQVDKIEDFGFFPNRNHTATYLAMGTICGLGNVLQALREKRFVAMAIAMTATAICFWAVAGWSVSRGGVILLAIGGLIWFSMLGRRYLGRHGLWAFALIGLAVIGLFFIADSRVKKRLATTIEQSDTAHAPASTTTPSFCKITPETTNYKEFRVPMALDTLRLIRDFKWTGIGAGQFYYIFPQYRKLSVVANDQDAYHPESDWLWMAAEAGAPATLALLALVALAFGKSWIEVCRGRERALRGACLVAAMLVPIHGLFDVPGHRITLAWSAALLFALSLHAPADAVAPRPPREWPWRAFALGLMLAAAWLISAEWWSGPKPAVTTAGTALAEARRLYRDDQAMQQAAAANGLPYQPDPADDRLEKALTILKQATSTAPLDRDIRRYEAFLAFNFDDHYDQIDRAFAIDLALDPTWVGAPMRQAEAWVHIDPQRSEALWIEALRRAAYIDRIQPGTDWSSANTLRQIQQLPEGKAALEKRVSIPK